MRISWLHLSDLHVSDRALPFYINDTFRKDLEIVHQVAGPFQFVLFTGDLVQRGAPAEFQNLTKWLEKIFTHLRKLGSTPTLLAVPGNHDLVRPALDPAVRCLLDWKNDPEVQADFWSRTKSRSDPYRQVIGRAFEPYLAWLQEWYERHPPAAGVELRQRGLLPGDMSASITHAGRRLGLVGLNSSFLHLADVDRGGVTVDPLQLEEACDGDPSEWCERHDVNLLATHHPHTWFENPTRYEVEIYHPTWFAAHLFGHMHEPTSIAQQVAGGAPRRYFQAPSLFGTESTRAGVKRIFGYAAKQLEFGERQNTMRIWPRIAKILSANTYQFIPDFSFQLEQSGTFSNSFAMELQAKPAPNRGGPPSGPARPNVASAGPGSASGSGAATTSATLAGSPSAQERRAAVPLPWAPYSKDSYVKRGVEKSAIALLAQPGTTVLISGPPACGKSMLLSHLVETLRAASPTTGVLRLGLGRLTRDELHDPPAAFRQLLTQVAEACRVDGQSPPGLQAELDELAQLPMSPELALTQVFETLLARGGQERVVLVLDQWEKVNNRPLAAPLVQMLRPWVQDHRPGSPWARFRLVMAASGSSLYFDQVTVVSEFFNIAYVIRLGHLSESQVKDLARMHGGDWSDAQLNHLYNDLLRGQPFLTRHVLYLRSSGIPIEELLDRRLLREQYCDGQLQQLWLNMKDEPDLFDAFSTLVSRPDIVLDPGVRAKLKSAGLAETLGDGKLQPATPLLADYFRDRG